MNALLAAGLWLLADRAGRLEDRPKRIKAQLLPWDRLDVDAALNDLQRCERQFRTRGSLPTPTKPGPKPI